MVLPIPITPSTHLLAHENLPLSNYAELPSLPVPSLESTMKKYLKSVQPFLNRRESAITLQVVKDFFSEDGIGSKLQTMLEEKAKGQTNWLADWWLQTAYLDVRSSLVVHSSPGYIWPLKSFSNKKDQLYHAARIILAALDYKDLANMQQLPQDMAGEVPLDMVQYKRLMGTCRIPGLKSDRLSYADSSYISVFHNNHIFILSVVGEDDIRLNEEQLVKQLEEIVKKSLQPLDNCIGVLTSENRDNWGKTYSSMLNDELNKSNLEKIEQSLFSLCLDRSCNIEKLDDSKKQNVAAEQTVHGGGSNMNSGNRWFDKTIQFIINEDGINGICYEHSPAEGQPVANLADYIIKFIDDAKSLKNPPSNVPKGFIQLDFNISKEIEEDIELAKTNIDLLVSNLEIECFTFRLFGKEFIKSQKLSPDSFIQMAIQLAFYRIHREPPAHYEAASTHKYTEGRTETIRSCSEESVLFSKVMLDREISSQVKFEVLHKAVKSHKAYAVEAGNGFGIDRHLLGLKLTALDNNIQIPEFYLDYAYVKSTHMKILSSQVSSKCEGLMCFGPMVSDGYSTCYNLRSGDILFSTTAFKECRKTCATTYRKAIEDSLLDMYDLIFQANM